MKRKLLLSLFFTLTLSFFSSFSAMAETEVVVSGTGGGDVSGMTRLLQQLSSDLKSDGIRINYQPNEGEFHTYILNALSAGTAPDVFYVDVLWAEPLYASGQIAPLPMAYFKETKEAILPVLADAFTYNDQLYGIAKDFNSLTVVFNKDIFDEAGVEYLSDDDTWSDFKTKLKAVGEELDDVHSICLVADYARFATFSFAAGWKLFNEDGDVVLDDKFKEGFAYYADLLKSTDAVVAADAGQAWTGGCLGNEISAVALEGGWIANFLRDQAPNMEFGTVKLPKNPRTKERGNFIFTVAWSIPEKAKNKEKIFQTIQHLTGEKAQQWVLESGWAIPSRKAMSESDFFQRENKYAQLSKIAFGGASDGYVYPYSFGQYGVVLRDIFNAAMNSVLLGEKSVDSAINDAQKQLDQLTARKVRNR